MRAKRRGEGIGGPEGDVAVGRGGTEVVVVRESGFERGM